MSRWVLRQLEAVSIKSSQDARDKAAAALPDEAFGMSTAQTDAQLIKTTRSVRPWTRRTDSRAQVQRSGLSACRTAAEAVSG